MLRGTTERTRDQNGASFGGVLLLTDATLTEVPESKPEMPSPDPGEL